MASRVASGGSTPRVLNINVGILGHVDSGKTTLARAMSTLLSTASLDKNPQSLQRGITLDLGFSAFMCDLPPSLSHLPYDQLQFTLVDCPGHASLIRTIMGGAQIIDIMMLVVDVTKGMQTQTAECLVVGEISPTSQMVVVLNKCDLLPPVSRAAHIDKMSRRIRATLKNTKFASAAIVPAAANPTATAITGGGGAMRGGAAQPGIQPAGVADVAHALVERVAGVRRSSSSPSSSSSGNPPLVFAVDHCFPIKGQGTIMTGTVLQGQLAVNDTVQLPLLRLERKVKSMQMFHRPVLKASQGDRVGVCVTQLDPQLLERGIVCTPGSVPVVRAAVCAVKRVPFFKSPIASKAKFHVTIGHSTVLASVLFFSHPAFAFPSSSSSSSGHDDDDASSISSSRAEFQIQPINSREYTYLACLGESGEEGGKGADHLREQGAGSREGRRVSSSGNAEAQGGEGGTTLSPSPSPTSNVQEDERDIQKATKDEAMALLTFDSEVVCPPSSLLIGSRLDTDIYASSCRIAFHGRLLSPVDPHAHGLRIFKWKTREGVVDRVVDSHTILCRGLFKKETDLTRFLGLKVSVGPRQGSAIQGTINSPFGKTGKVKVTLSSSLSPTLSTHNIISPGSPVILTCKKFLFDKSKRVHQ